MWLLKTEPSDYSFDRLEQEGRTRWDGVSSPAALKNIRAMKPGERAFVYHTGKEKAVVGVVEITSAAYPDPAARDARHVVVDVEVRARLGRPVTLAEIKALPAFGTSPLVRQGRLSVVSLSEEQWRTIEEWGRG